MLVKRYEVVWDSWNIVDESHCSGVVGLFTTWLEAFCIRNMYTDRFREQNEFSKWLVEFSVTEIEINVAEK